METEWNSLDDAARADFAAWREQRQAERLEAARVEAARNAKPKQYGELSDAERAAFHRRTGLRQPIGRRA